MLKTIISAIFSSFATEIDDILLLIFLFSLVSTKKNTMFVCIGKIIGFIVIVAVSVLGAYGLSFFCERYLFLLGIVPLALGIKEFFTDKDDDKVINNRSCDILAVALLTISGGGDNLGVYIPLFVGLNISETVITILIFAVMCLLFCLLSVKISNFPAVKKLIEKCGKVIVPIVYIALGVTIIVSGLK